MKKSIGFLILPVPGLLIAVSLLFSACRSKPDPRGADPAKPSAALVFSGVEADDPGSLSLFYSLEVAKPAPGLVKIESWQVNIEGQNASFAFSLEYPEAGAYLTNPSTPLKLNMDAAALAAKNLMPKDTYSVTLILQLAFFPAPDSPGIPASSARLEVISLAEFPVIQSPVFTITSIAILKAELVNTRFRVGLKIDNPNPFPVALSAFSYRLYGNGMYWAEGRERNIVDISEKSSVEGHLLMIMNFIDMDRNLLNQIINLENVNYRFAGEAQISTTVEFLPKFMSSFDLSGYSVVLEN